MWQRWLNSNAQPICTTIQREERVPRNSVARMQSLCRRIFPIGFKKEFLAMLKIAWPAVLTSFLQFFLQTVSIIMCGNLSKAELAAAGLANSMINVFGLSIGMGMSTACDTFFSQTFGSGNKKKVGTYLQKSLVIMNLVGVLICCIHMNIQPFLMLIGQNPEIIKLTSNYMLCFMPGIFFDYNYLVLARYLQNQNILYPSLLCAMLGNVVNIVSQYLCIYVFGFKYLASAVCQASSFFVMMTMEIIYIFVSKVYKDTWDGFKYRDMLCDWKPFAKLAVPGIFLIGLEEWSFEIATFVAGMINTVELGVQTVLFQMETLCYMVPLGLSIAVNIRVGQNLGASRPDHAKTSYRVGLTIVMITASVMATAVISFRGYIPMLFTKDKDIIAGVSGVLILNAGFQFSDGIAATSAGALRGCGRQLTGAGVLFCGYYVISLPIGVSLALLTHLRVFGLWIGLLIGISTEAIVFIVVVNSTDWNHQCRRAAVIANGPNRHLDRLLEYEEIDAIVEYAGSEIESNEDEPLLGAPRRRRRRSSRMRNSITASLSTRAAVDPATVEIPEPPVPTDEAFKKIVFNRMIIFGVVIIIVIAAIFIRIMQPEQCVPVNNSSKADYFGILPFCNVTVV